MENEVISTLAETFEGHAQTTEDGVEYWLTRDVQFVNVNSLTRPVVRAT